MLRVDIGIACNKNQDHKWWAALMPEVLRLERAGLVELGELWPIGSALTDYNRNEVVELYDPRGADALWFIDDDTKPPAGALEHLADLMEAGVAEIVAGIYYSRNELNNPIAYKRLPNMGYVALTNFQVGEIVAADSVGMGCTLIHRDVFDGIREHYQVFRRLRSGTVFPVHREDVVQAEGVDTTSLHAAAGKLVVGPGRGYFVDPVSGPVEDFDHWPFFAFEYGRTEDHPFCEMAKRCGFRIVVDTGIECGHIGTKEWGGKDFRQTMDALGSYRKLKSEMLGG